MTLEDGKRNSSAILSTNNTHSSDISLAKGLVRSGRGFSIGSEHFSPYFYQGNSEPPEESLAIRATVDKPEKIADILHPRYRYPGLI
jgi:hypothetical protein